AQGHAGHADRVRRDQETAAPRRARDARVRPRQDLDATRAPRDVAADRPGMAADGRRRRHRARPGLLREQHEAAIQGGTGVRARPDLPYSRGRHRQRLLRPRPPARDGYQRDRARPLLHLAVRRRRRSQVGAARSRPRQAGRGTGVLADERWPSRYDRAQPVRARGRRAQRPGDDPWRSALRDVHPHDGGPMGISAPAALIKIPWNPRMANRLFMMDPTLVTKGLVKPKPATWLEEALWGHRYRVTISWGDVQSRGLFRIYFARRDRVLHLSEDPSRLVVNFDHADRLKIDEMVPNTARRELSETL